MPYHIHITGQVLPVGHHVPFRVLLGIAGQQATKVTVFDAQAKRIAVIRIIVIILGAYDLDFRAAQGKGIPLRRVGHRYSFFCQCVLQGLVDLGIGGIVGHQRLLHRRGVERAHQTADVILVIVGSHQPFQFGHPVLLEIGDHIAIYPHSSHSALPKGTRILARRSGSAKADKYTACPCMTIHARKSIKRSSEVP